MKKLQIALLSIILLILLIKIVGCKNIKKSDYRSSQDPLQSFNSDVEKARDPLRKEVKDGKVQEKAVKQDTTKHAKVDDWVYVIGRDDADGSFYTGGLSPSSNIRYKSAQSTGNYFNSPMASYETESANLGFSVGGAKDINNFRENIKNNYMPVMEDISHEGIFYDYFFDNNITKKATHLFEPAYTFLKNKHPLTNEEEIYLSVGLNSNLTKASFARKKLNLTIVLDISGSMSSSFDKYYYDGHERKEYGRDGEDFDDRSKMEVAKDCIIDLTKHLKNGDRLAVVLFDNQSYLAKPFNLVGETDMEAIRTHIKDLQPRGGTNMYDGIKSASELYSKLPAYDAKEYDNRIIFLTDAMPNTNVTDKNSLWGVMKVNAEQKIYTTFVGVGVDLNNELIKYVTKTPGANYYSVHNAKEFKQRMDTQFDFMVTPLVFDLTLHLESENYEIQAVYGSPEADQATGEIMKVNTLFPSETEDGQTKGGIILIKLKKKGIATDDLKLTCSYKDRNGIPYLNSEKINLSKSVPGTDNGIRKAVLLSRYVNLMQAWINNKTVSEVGDDWQYKEQLAKPIPNPRSEWERNSHKLAVSPYYKEELTKFKKHFAMEATAIKDQELRQELDILEKLVDGVD